MGVFRPGYLFRIDDADLFRGKYCSAEAQDVAIVGCLVASSLKCRDDLVVECVSYTIQVKVVYVSGTYSLPCRFGLCFCVGIRDILIGFLP